MYSEKKNEGNKILEIYLSIIENEKKIMQNTVLGYCPNNIVEKIFCISIEGIVLQESIAMWWA